MISMLSIYLGYSYREKRGRESQEKVPTLLNCDQVIVMLR